MQPSSRNMEAILTPREKDILQLIASGNSTREIAGQLFVSINTVESQEHAFEDRSAQPGAPR